MSMMDATLTGPTKTPETKRIAGASAPVRPRSRRRRPARRDHAHLLCSIEAMQVDLTAPVAHQDPSPSEEWPNTLLIDDLGSCEDPRENALLDF